MTRAIVAIGGGSIRRGTLINIDREIIRLTRKKRPRVLFLPTASSDSIQYWNEFQKYFGKRLHCRTDALFLIRGKPTMREMRSKILAADIIYVGGGNTLMMRRVWRRLGLDHLLKKAYHRGIILSGISAGSICWFESGHSDSRSFSNPKRWKYILVKGLGIVPGIHCPHYNSQTRGIKRRKNFQRMIHKRGGIGIALDDACAMFFVDGSYRVVSTRKNAKAYKVIRTNGVVQSQRIPEAKDFVPLRSLLM